MAGVLQEADTVSRALVGPPSEGAHHIVQQQPTSNRGFMKTCTTVLHVRNQSRDAPRLVVGLDGLTAPSRPRLRSVVVKGTCGKQRHVDDTTNPLSSHKRFSSSLRMMQPQLAWHGEGLAVERRWSMSCVPNSS